MGEYVLEEPLGQGGFATVWRAGHHAWPDRKVAAKLLHDPDRADLLRQEAECLTQLDHPGIAGAVGMDLDHDPPYLLVELHEGRTLRDLLRAEGPLPPSRAYPIFAQLAAALAHSHARGIAHGDLKPENVLIGPGGQLKLTDFGLGRIRAGEASLLLSGDLASLTQPQASLAGTLPYMAPEQRDGEPPCPRTDVFALGIVLHELLTGRRPQPGDDPREELAEPPGWLAVWERSFARRDRRFADAGELLEALGAPQVTDGPVAAPLLPAVATAGPWSIEEVERAVAGELGVPLGRLHGDPRAPVDGVDRLIAWAEEQLTGGERDLREARRIVWYVATEVLGVSAGALADRYGVPAKQVLAEARSVPRGGVRLGSWRAVVERLAPLSLPVQRSLRESERGPGAVRFVGALVAWWMALVCAVLGVFKPALLLLVPALFAAGWVAVRRARREHAWIEAHLSEVPGADRRAKLARLALHTEFPRVAAAARANLGRALASAAALRELPPSALAEPGAASEPAGVVEGVSAEPARLAHAALEADGAEAPRPAEGRANRLEPAEADEEARRAALAPSGRSVEAVRRALGAAPPPSLEPDRSAPAETAEPEPEPDSAPEREPEGADARPEAVEAAQRSAQPDADPPRSARPPIEEALRHLRRDEPSRPELEGAG